MQIRAALVSTFCVLDSDCMLTTARAQTHRQRVGDRDRVGGRGGGCKQKGERQRAGGGVNREGGDRQRGKLGGKSDREANSE